MPNTITMTSEYPSLVDAGAGPHDVLRFYLGSAMGGIVSAQRVPLIGWHGILALGGILPLMLFSACCSRAGLPAGRYVANHRKPVVARLVSAITGERYLTHAILSA